MPDKNDPEEEALITASEFLESTSPGQWKTALGFSQDHPTLMKQSLVAAPDIRLFCVNDACNGYRFFKSDDRNSVQTGGQKLLFITYHCRNCGKSQKLFSLWLKVHSDAVTTEIMKLGEWPEFGPPTPSRVIKLIGPDRDAFLKGRRSENQGLGIGAFGYYRRVVEAQKNRILDEIIKVSEKLGATKEILDELRLAKEEVQFTKAIGSIKHGIPQALMVNGHNPLTLLHSALSEGLHAQSDEECLELAKSIRVVLTELADRLGQALKDEAELNHAVNRLMQVKIKKNG